ncbi:hypothetical protein [Thiolinea disciformis]|uniref:hypothetical protein n=1 Tax=Thiolinea disciformis TaxID=125614 RepID=UPI00037B1A98|nr:hypothetical protein [Thiolinea disciformis]
MAFSVVGEKAGAAPMERVIDGPMAEAKRFVEQLNLRELRKPESYRWWWRIVDEVDAPASEDFIALKTLTPELKGKVWQRMKERKPAKAALFKDPFVLALQQEFGAEWLITTRELKELTDD